MSGLAASLEDGLLILTINEPERRNPVGHQARQLMAQYLSEAERDRDVRAVVPTGAGGNFSTGGDIRDQNGISSIMEARARFAAVKDLVTRMAEFPKPLVSAVEGWAAGGGFAVALACETVVASESARFGKIGLIPDLWSVRHTARPHWRLPRTARLPDLGGHRCEGRREARPRGCAGAGRGGTGKGHRPGSGIHRASGAGLHQGLPRSGGGPRARIRTPDQPLLLRSADAVEGRAAFFEKRAPVFRGE